MKITYIHHSSFSVETEKATLLFDYYAGPLPAFAEDRPLIVFASHFHADHFSPVVFELAGHKGGAQYILSHDIRPGKVPKELRERTRFVKAGETFELAYAQGEAAMRIETLRSTDEGVAFWISCDGKEIYHAGDLNNWWWEGEDKAWNHNMAANYKKEMEKLAGRTADAAFIPLDPRLEDWFYLGMEGFMEKADARAIFPMHFWKDYSVIERMKRHPASAGWRDRIVDIREEGEVFER